MKNINNDLTVAQFSGSNKFYKHYFGAIYTEGVHYVCETYSCYWFLDIILSYQLESRFKAEEFQTWELSKIKDDEFLVTSTDGNGNILCTQVIPFSDFEGDKLTFWFEDNVIYLPRER